MFMESVRFQMERDRQNQATRMVTNLGIATHPQSPGPGICRLMYRFFFVYGQNCTQTRHVRRGKGLPQYNIGMRRKECAPVTVSSPRG